MSSVSISFSDIKNASSTATKVADKLTEYAGTITDDIRRKLQNYSGGTTNNISTARTHTWSKVQHLTSEADRYRTYSADLTTLCEECERVDVATKTRVSELTASFRTNYNINVSVIDSVNMWCAGVVNSTYAGRWLNDKLDASRANSKYEDLAYNEWYNYLGGKEKLEAEKNALNDTDLQNELRAYELSQYTNQRDDDPTTTNEYDPARARRLREMNTMQDTMRFDEAIFLSGAMTVTEAYRSAYELDEIELKRKIAEEEQERKKREQVAAGIKIGVGIACAIGSVLAIAAIVSTGGAATPLVMGAVSAVSGAVSSGVGNVVDQWADDGSLEDFDAGSFAVDTLVWGAGVGFISGWAGGVAGDKIQGSLNSARWVQVGQNSGKMLNRIGTHAFVNTTKNLGSGVVERSIKSVSEDVIYDHSIDVTGVLKDTFDGTSIIIDTTSGVADGIADGTLRDGFVDDFIDDMESEPNKELRRIKKMEAERYNAHWNELNREGLNPYNNYDLPGAKIDRSLHSDAKAAKTTTDLIKKVSENTYDVIKENDNSENL